MMVRKLTAIVLMLLMIASLVACNDAKETVDQATTVVPTETLETTVEETTIEEPTKEPTQAETDDSLVVDAVYKELTDPFSSEICYYHIPKINLTNGLADEINQKMLKDGEEYIVDAYESIDNKVSIISSGCNYLWGCKDNVVSVLVAEAYGSSLAYNTYNFSIDSGEILTNDDLREVYGFSEQELTDLIITKAREKFEKEYKTLKEQSGDSYYLQYQKTIAAENAEKSQLYINTEGDLCSVTIIYSLAGASSYFHVLNLTGNTPAQDPDVMS